MTRWLLGGLAAAAAAGWLAAVCHTAGWAPVGILSLTVGAALGWTLTRLARATGVSGRALVVGTVVLAVTAVVAEHAWLYRDFRRQWREARLQHAQLALFRQEDPWSPREYFVREFTPARAALWGVDAALVVGGAVGTVAWWRRLRP